MHHLQANRQARRVVMVSFDDRERREWEVGCKNGFCYMIRVMTRSCIGGLNLTRMNTVCGLLDIVNALNVNITYVLLIR